MATFVELYGELLDTELGSADRTARFTTTRRKDRINKAQQEFNRLTECFVRSFAVPLVDNTREYELQAAITNADFLKFAKQGLEVQQLNAAAQLTTYSGPDLPRLEISVLNAKFPGWRTQSKGIPQSWYLREDGGQVLLGFDRPINVGAGETWTALIPYVAQPPNMVNDADEPFAVAGTTKTTLRPWHQGLVHFAAAKLELLRRDFERSQAQMQAFGGYVADYLQTRRPKGGQIVQLVRDYGRESAASSFFPWTSVDPRR